MKEVATPTGDVYKTGIYEKMKRSIFYCGAKKTSLQ